MARVIVSLDTDTKKCEATIDGIPLDFDTISLVKTYYKNEDGEKGSHVNFWYEQIKEMDDGMIEFHRFSVIHDSMDDEHNQSDGFVEIAGLKIPFTVTTNGGVKSDIGNFIISAKKNNRK